MNHQNQTEMVQSNLLSVEAACAFFGCGRTTLYKYMLNGLPSYKIGGHRRFKLSDCIAYAEPHRRQRAD